MQVSNSTEADEMESAIDFKRHPYRGVFSEAADKLGISRVAARKSSSPKVRRLILKIIHERRELHREYESLVRVV
jgi:hypothetical protein